MFPRQKVRKSLIPRIRMPKKKKTEMMEMPKKRPELRPPREIQINKDYKVMKKLWLV